MVSDISCGYRFDGRFVNGIPHGWGTETQPTGEKTYAEYRNGEMVLAAPANSEAATPCVRNRARPQGSPQVAPG